MSDCCAFYRGKVSFSSEPEVWREIGNASRLVLMPVVDDMVPLDADLNDTCCGWISCGIELTFSCMTPENLSMALSSLLEYGPSQARHNAGTRCGARGALKFDGFNQFGGQIQLFVPYVEFRPTGNLNMISTEIEQITLTGSVRLKNTSEGTWFNVVTYSEETC
jgi:hypothetical protein